MIKLSKYRTAQDYLILILLTLGFYPIGSLLYSTHQGSFLGQWVFWLFFYFFTSITITLYFLARVFFQKRFMLYGVLYLTFFISLSSMLRLIPLPLGMSLAFLVPILVAALVHPFWGSLVGFFSILVSSVMSGGIGPWLPMQGYIMLVIGAALYWVPASIRSRLGFIMFYGLIWGLLYGLIMSLVYWPLLAKLMDQGFNLMAFSTFYFTTSFVWDVCRAIGNSLFLALGYRTFSNIALEIKKMFQ